MLSCAVFTALAQNNIIQVLQADPDMSTLVTALNGEAMGGAGLDTMPHAGK